MYYVIVFIIITKTFGVGITYKSYGRMTVLRCDSN